MNHSGHHNLNNDLPPRIHNVLDEGPLPGRHRIAFIDEQGKKWSYDRLIGATEDAANTLRELGIGPGDRLMLVCENSIAGIALVFAASKLDATTAIINARLSRREVDVIREDCEPARVVYTDANSENAKEHAARHGATKQNFGEIGELMVSAPNNESKPFECSEDPGKQVAILIYTTGTTGRPKGVMLSHRNLMFVAVRGKRVGFYGPADVGLCLMPIAHSYGFAQMAGLIFAGGRHIIMPRFKIDEVMNLVSSGTLTTFAAVPSLYARLVDTCAKQDRTLIPNSIRYLLIGTAPLDVTLRRGIENVFGNVLSNGYGLTETSPTISRSQYQPGSDEVDIGPPVPGVEVKIVDDNGDEVETGQPGELWVRGPNVMVGYFRNPEATAAIFDDQGFMNTGDVVRQNENGVMNLAGRTKELIIRSGFNVYPVEVEAQLNAHPSVPNSAVVGCDVRNDEAIVGFLEQAPGANIDTEEVIAFLKDRIAAYKIPTHLFIVDALPYSPNAKILKKQLKDQAIEMLDRGGADVG